MTEPDPTMPDIVMSGPLEADQSEDSLQVVTSGDQLAKEFSEFKDAVSGSDSYSDPSDDDGDDHFDGVERFFTHESGEQGNSPESASAPDLKPDETTDEYILELLGEKSGNGLLIRKYEGWLSKDVLLQGKFYVTNRYLLFYAPLAPPALEVVRASPLAKKSVRMIPVIGRASYSRHWFVLRMGTFAWYSSSADIYFPIGLIPLHTVRSVEVLPRTPEKFLIKCANGKSYSFKADSRNTAHEWCKAILKEAFKARNKNVKPSAIVRIPLENIISSHHRSVLDFGRLLRVKVVSEITPVEVEVPNMESPPPLEDRIGNYTFLFFGRGQEAQSLLEVLQTETNNFSNQAGVVLVPYEDAYVVDRVSSAFGQIHEAVFDTTPPIDFPLRTADYSDDLDTASTNILGLDLTPTESTSPSISTAASSVYEASTEQPPTSPTSRTPSISRSASTRALKQQQPQQQQSQQQHHHHHHHHLHLSKINILSSLTHKLHISSEEKSVEAGQVKFEPPSKEEELEEDESDNEENADSDSEESYSIPEELESKKYKKFFDDQILPLAPHAVAKKLVMGLSRTNSTNRIATFTKPSSGSRTPVLSPTPGQLSPVSRTPTSATPVTSPPATPGNRTPVRRERVLQQNGAIDEINRWFRDHFGLDRDSVLFAEYMCSLSNQMDNSNWSGRLFISNHFLCFQRRHASSNRWRIVIPLRDITHMSELDPTSTSIVLEVAEPAYGKIKVSFSDVPIARDAEDTLKYALSQSSRRDSHSSTGSVDGDSEARFLEYSLRSARLATYEPSVTVRLKHQIPPLMFDPTSTQFKEAFLRKPMETLKFAMLMIGSRGDVQPYIALSQGLMEEGHKCLIISHKEFRPWVESFGIEFREIAGDPSELMEIMISHGSISYGFVRDALAHFKGWLKELMQTSWHAMKDSGANVLIESPSSMIGIHIAEALNIPYFRAFTMPWTRTKAYPQALVSSDQTKGGAYNSFTYAMYDRLVWFCISKYVNRWRKKHLDLPETSLDSLAQDKVPFLYCVSPTVLMPPLDQFDWVHSCGYWELRPNKHEKKKGNDPKLVEFIAKARDIGKKIVYIGFGSIIVSNPEAMTNTVIEATRDAGVYCVLARGWSSRSAAKKGDKDKAKEKAPIREEHVYEVDSVDHQWLFPQIDVCVHHGGSGTTGASLRAGRPTIIKPFFGDQFFYGARVEDLNVGVNLKVLNTEDLSAALKKCVTDTQLIRQASVLGEQIRHEHGVEEAILAIYQELDYAKEVTSRRRKQTKENAEAGIFPDPKVLLQIPGFGLGKAGGDGDISNLSWFQLPTLGRREEQRRHMSKYGKVDVSL